MEPGALNPRGAKITDQQLRADIQAGLKPAAIARKHNISRQAVSLRVKQLDLTTASALVAPQESQLHVRRNLDVMEQLAQNVVRANLLQDACHEWLTDAGDPAKYDLGPRAEEVEVTYSVEVRTPTGFRTEKRKNKLSHLMACLEGEDEDGARFCGWKHGEYKRADPRELILKTQSETRATMALVIDAIQKLTDSRIMEDFRKAVIEEVRQESPDCARRIAERLQRSIILHAAFAGPGGISAAGDAN